MKKPRKTPRKKEEVKPKMRYDTHQRRMTYCQSDCDGYCEWKHCPQLRDGEPAKSGRHCPLDKLTDEDQTY